VYNEIKTIDDAKKVIAEQDRMIGELIRERDWLKDSERKREEWLRKAKQEAGYHNNISFDIVWEETLNKAKKLSE